jgi:4'-phosphopantetheinyl transferase
MVWVVELDVGLRAGGGDDAREPLPELELLSADEQGRAARYVRACDRRRFVRCRHALREILGALVKVPTASIRFRATGQGKPELDPESALVDPRGLARNLHFNVSHSGGLALVGVSAGREIGVDLERVRAIEEADRIVASFFSPGELAAFGSIAADDKPMAFMRGWTRKEAILKGLGIGLAGLAARYETWFAATALEPCFNPVAPLAQVGDWELWEAAPRPEYVAALAIASPKVAEAPPRPASAG